MKKVLLSFLFLMLIILLQSGHDKALASTKYSTLTRQQNSRTGFIENKGQIIDQNHKPNPAVLYLLNTPGMNVQLRKGGFSYDLYCPTSSPSLLGEGPGWGLLPLGGGAGSGVLRVTRHASRVTIPLSSIIVLTLPSKEPIRIARLFPQTLLRHTSIILRPMCHLKELRM